jgi:hypothetical protein
MGNLSDKSSTKRGKAVLKEVKTLENKVKSLVQEQKKIEKKHPEIKAVFPKPKRKASTLKSKTKKVDCITPSANTCTLTKIKDTKKSGKWEKLVRTEKRKVSKS